MNFRWKPAGIVRNLFIFETILRCVESDQDSLTYTNIKLVSFTEDYEGDFNFFKFDVQIM